MKGIQITHMAKFYTIPKGNIPYGQGQGVITIRDSSGDMATEIGHGIGEFIDIKKVSRSFFTKLHLQENWLFLIVLLAF